MDVHRLRVLRAVVADGSINGAAASLGYTPSAISQHLTALQRETGLQLVQRDGRGISPTAAGYRLATASARVFAELAELEALAGDLRAGRVGSLSVSYFASAGAAWIPAVVAQITREFPGLRLDLRLVELLGAGAGAPDVEIVVTDTTATPTGYHSRTLLTEPYFAVVPAGSALADRSEIALGELRDEAWVDNDVTRGPCRQAVLDACSTAGFSPSFQIETQDYPTAISFVAEGMGITVIPRLGLGGGLRGSVVAVPIVHPTPERTIAVRVRDTVADNPAVVRILELLDERVAAA